MKANVTLTRDALADAHKQGNRFFLRTLGEDCKHCGGWTNVEMIVSTSDPDCKDTIMSWIKKHDTRSVSVRRILPDGSSEDVGIFSSKPSLFEAVEIG